MLEMQNEIVHSDIHIELQVLAIPPNHLVQGYVKHANVIRVAFVNCYLHLALSIFLAVLMHSREYLYRSHRLEVGMLKRMSFLYELNSLRAYISIASFARARAMFIPFSCDVCTCILLVSQRVKYMSVLFTSDLPFPTANK